MDACGQKFLREDIWRAKQHRAPHFTLQYSDEIPTLGWRSSRGIMLGESSSNALKADHCNVVGGDVALQYVWSKIMATIFAQQGSSAAEQLPSRRLMLVGDICTAAKETVQCKDWCSGDREAGGLMLRRAESNTAE